MKKRSTFYLRHCLWLILLFIAGRANAQYPKLVNNYPTPQGQVLTTASNGNTLFLGGNFAGFKTNDLNYGIPFKNVNSNMPIAGSLSPDGIVASATSDGAGGFYIGGQFSTVGGVT